MPDKYQKRVIKQRRSTDAGASEDFMDSSSPIEKNDQIDGENGIIQTGSTHTANAKKENKKTRSEAGVTLSGANALTTQREGAGGRL